MTSKELTTFMEAELGVDTSDIGGSTPLFSSGIIDSFSLVSLLTFIENTCNFQVEPIDVNLENMDTIENILKYVESKADSA